MEISDWVNSGLHILNSIVIPGMVYVLYAINKNREDLAQYKVHIAETYVTDNELTKQLGRIEGNVSEVKALMISIVSNQQANN